MTPFESFPPKFLQMFVATWQHTSVDLQEVNLKVKLKNVCASKFRKKAFHTICGNIVSLLDSFGHLAKHYQNKNALYVSIV